MSQTTADPAGPTTVPNTGFRLGDKEHFSDATDSDQSHVSRRSLSPTQTKAQVPKSRRQKNRRKMGALADELVDVLGDAFSARNTDAVDDINGTGLHTNNAQDMEVESEPTGKRMNKRTRQNLVKMQARKAKNGGRSKDNTCEEHVVRAQTAAAERRGMSLEQYLKERNPGDGRRKNTAAARRARKGAVRSKQAAADEDRMDIG